MYPYDKWSTNELPCFIVGETLQPSRLEMIQGKTSPPQLLTEADLISLMDKHEIGNFILSLKF